MATRQAEVKRRMSEGEFAELPPECLLYPTVPKEPYATRRFDAGEVMYTALGIERDDQAGRMDQVHRNYECFGAPAALFFAIDRDLQQGQWAELGMFMNALMLLVPAFVEA